MKENFTICLHSVNVCKLYITSLTLERQHEFTSPAYMDVSNKF